jgi:hypothetical protein
MLYKSGVEEYIDDCYIPKSMGGSSPYVHNVNELHDVIPEDNTNTNNIETNGDTNTLCVDTNTNTNDDEITRIQKEIDNICVSNDETTSTSTTTNSNNNEDATKN